MENRPHGREKHVTGDGREIRRRGSGLGSGPAGRTDGMPGRPSGSGSGMSGTGSSAGNTRGLFGGKGFIAIIIAVIVLLGGGGAGLSGLFGGSGGSGSGFDLGSLLTGGSVTNTSTGWIKQANTGKLDTSVASGSRAKRTQILGGGRDTVTVMLYMCGTDLESKNGMATADLQEIQAASLGGINFIIYTGGCSRWKNSVVSSSCNQIYKVENGGLRCLVKNAGSASMTKPATLTEFIRYCTDNYPASRNELIFWDHGGGAISGFGYDENNKKSGSMTLKGINEALKSAGATFDFIGFDACLMGTLENALTMAPYADYLIASEETEPGVGWYYTGWLNALGADPSAPTLEIGRVIVDDFVSFCGRNCAGQKATLSVIDLAELENTVPSRFRSFATDTAGKLKEDEYKTVSEARSSAREFAPESKVDQVDLVNLAYNLGSGEGEALAQAILGAVKYNRTSSNMTNAYGLSVYFPYRKTGSVDSAVAAYDAIGIDSEYSRCIQQFATLETGGQAISGSGSPLTTLFGGSGGTVSGDMISDVLSGLLGGSSFFGKDLDMDRVAGYLAENRFDPSALVWEKTDGGYGMVLSEEQWSLVSVLDLNVFYDDGEGYIDLGCDNVFDFNDDGALLGEYDGTWIAVNGQPVAYYHTDTVEDGGTYVTTGRIPVLLNDSFANLIVVFDSAHPGGYIAGVRTDYRDGETDTVAKGASELAEGDRIVFLCDYYSYDGEYLDSFRMTDEWTYAGEDIEISNVRIDRSAASAYYKFTDIYNQSYWSPVMP